MEPWKFRTTNKSFDYIDFHDCRVEEIRFEKESIVIYFEFVYISGEHPLNPYDCAKSTDRCRLCFNGVTEYEAYVDYGGGSKKEVLITNLDEMEFLQFNQDPSDSHTIYEMFGTDWRSHQFCSIKIHALNFTLEWNEFTEDAWYVN